MFDFVLNIYCFVLLQGLGDRHEVVRKDMLAAAVVTIDNHGKNTVSDLLPVFEDFLDNAPSDSSYDIVRQSVVILMGGLARHLEKDDPKVRPIIGKLIAALVTPSQPVQEAVANCLPPLGELNLYYPELKPLSSTNLSRSIDKFYSSIEDER